jgi:class 3 adenylate cyclase/HAMP domain-containing protein
MTMTWPKLGVAARLMTGLAILALVAAIGGGVAVVSFDQFRDSFDRVASTQLDSMVAAAQLEQESQALAGLAPELFVKGLGTGTLLAFTTEVYGQQVALQQLIEKLSLYAGDTASVSRIETATQDLFTNADELSTVIFSKAGAEDELRVALGKISRLYEEASRAVSAGEQVAAEAQEVEAARTWLGDAGWLVAQVTKLLSARTPDQHDAIAADIVERLESAAASAKAASIRIEALPDLHDQLAEALNGRRGVVSLRRQLIRAEGEARELLEESDSMSRELIKAVEALVSDIRADVAAQDTFLDQVLSSRTQVMTGLAVLGLLAALVIAAYFQLSVIRRLDRLRHSMRHEQSAESVTDLTDGHDEISEMARSFVYFVNEINRRDEDVRRSQRRLTNAIESISDGFSLYDDRDELVLSNSRYSKLLYPGLEDFVQPGQSFESIIEKAAEQGLIQDARGRTKEWLVERIAQHRNPKGTTVQQRGDGRWIEIKERRTDGGDTVAIYTDITERQNFEARLLAEKQRTEGANKRITEQNRMLESLSNQLSKYLSPQVYSSIFSGEQTMAIASKRKKLTVFFSDIAGFTETTDSLESEELTSLLNNYLTEMSKIALDYGATIDKYIGDAILIFFGDPESRGVKEDALACVEMAIAMQRRMRELQHHWADLGLERPFQLRIGINTGYCTVGNFGSEDRMDYTIIGNEVNLAERLQSHADTGGILLSHETYSLTKDAVRTREQEPISVKGFAKPIRNHSVAGIYDAPTQQRGVIRKERDGFGLRVDLDSLGDDDRTEVIREIEQVLSRLRRES